MTEENKFQQVMERMFEMRDFFMGEVEKFIKEELQSHPYGMGIAKVMEDEIQNLIKDGLVIVDNAKRFKDLVDNESFTEKSANEMLDCLFDSFEKENERMKFLYLMERFARETKKRYFTDDRWREVLDEYLEKVVRNKGYRDEDGQDDE